MTKKTIALSEQLEQMVLGAVLRGVVPFDLVNKDELSKVGRYVYEAMDRLRKSAAPPFDYDAVLAMATSVLGADEDDVRPYLKRVSLVSAGKEVGEIVRALRDRQVLIDVLNAASAQLEQCVLDKNALLACFDTQKSDSLVPLSEMVGETLPDPPSGIPLKSLPSLSRATGGFFGLWAIAGTPGVGKSTLATQIVLHVCQDRPVIYYDFENGLPSTLYRVGSVFGNVERLKAATSRFYMRESIRWLEADLTAIPAPALVVIDSVQKLPTSVEHRRTSLDRWVHRLEALKKRGYDVLLLSEKDRASYDRAAISGFKETGEIEYSADVGIQLLEGEDEDRVDLHIVKNRHRKNKGHVCTLIRHSVGWFVEEKENHEWDL